MAYFPPATLLRRYVPGPGTDMPIAMVTPSGGSNTRSYFHTNRQGSTVAMSADNGTMSEGPYTYDAYGRGAATTGVPFKYTGRRLDPETGLYYYRARYYSQALGRFLQTDPVGYTAGLNLYAYASHDPVNRSDPTGLADLNLHSPADPLYQAAEDFDVPGFFTIFAHGNPQGPQDMRGNTQAGKSGKHVPAYELADMAEANGHRRGERLANGRVILGEPILLISCKCGNAQYAQDLADTSISPVYATGDFAFSSNSRGGYRTGARIVVRVNSSKDDKGLTGNFSLFMPTGVQASMENIESITIDPDSGKISIRYASSAGSFIRVKTVNVCQPQGKCQ